jgi:hypothetical protein
LGAALVLGALGVLAISSGLVTYSGPIIPVLAGGVGALALPFFIRWLVDREEWWTLTTAWVFLSIALILLLIHLNPLFVLVVPMAILLAVAVPFMAMAAINPARWWGYIPAYALTALAGLLGLTAVGLTLEMLGALALLLTALPLWFLYIRDRSRNWALVPAGVISLIAVGLLVIFALAGMSAGPGSTVVVHGALAVAAFALWMALRRFDWALWLAIGFACGAAAAFWLTGPASWALPALALGSYILYRQLDARQAGKPASPAQAQTTAPASRAGSVPASQPSAAATPAPAPSPSPNPPAPNPDALKEQAESAERRGAAASPPPGVEFRPLDPFKDRKKDSD